MTAALRLAPFSDEHLAAAAELLAARHARLRAAEPGLNDRFTEPAAARELVRAALAGERASGWVAFDAGRLVGYLIGSVRQAAPWDNAGWVDLAGHATADGHADVARDLYAAWSEPVVRELGAFRHLVNVPAGDPEALDAWHDLDFGRMHCQAIRSTDRSDLAPPPDDIRVRDATPDDAAVMEATSELIWREQVGPPSWSPITREAALALRRDYVDELSEEEDRVWIAEDAATGEPLGVTISYPLEADLDVPDANMKLASTTTFPAARRRGVARALVHRVLEHAAEQGAPWCVTDWRTSSLLASRTWTALGFRRTRLRLERRLDERIAWAKGLDSGSPHERTR